MPQIAETATEHVDVVVVGAGIAGLVAAWSLSSLRCLVLESGDAPGGRVQSHIGAGGVINLGAHMVPTGDSLVGKLVSDFRLATQPLPASLFGIRDEGRLRLGLPVSALPFALKLSLTERVAFARLGLKLRLGAMRSVRLAMATTGDDPLNQRARMLGFEGDRTLAQYVGDLPPRVAELFQVLTERNGADPVEMTAGHGLRSFANVWAKTAPGANLVGGTQTLPNALAHSLGDQVRFGHRVSDVRSDGSKVRITYQCPEGNGSLIARACILATPAPTTLAVAQGLAQPVQEALSAIRYGPFLSLGVNLSAGHALPWRDTYAIMTPGLGFSVLFNHDAMRSVQDGMPDGHSLMLFRGASGAAREMVETDDQITARWLADLDVAFPETSGRILDVSLRRWRHGAPFAFPGRSQLQPLLEKGDRPIALAGDYLDFPNMEAAAQSGALAADRVRKWLSEND
jgi:oxygen-dependent protoporphyrinogen oxidase